MKICQVCFSLKTGLTMEDLKTKLITLRTKLTEEFGSDGYEVRSCHLSRELCIEKGFGTEVPDLFDEIFGDKYTGLGTGVIDGAVNHGKATYYDFLLKIVFTAVTMAIGFKGGEIVPTIFIGSTFGCAVSPLLGLDPTFRAAMGIVAVFCGVVNCPIASVMLSIELFGSEGIAFFVVAVCISYMLSGYYTLYSSQRIIYRKYRHERKIPE